MTGLHFDLTCPTCGAETRPVASGKVIMGREVSAIVRCCHCKNNEWKVTVRVTPFADHLT